MTQILCHRTMQCQGLVTPRATLSPAPASCAQRGAPALGPSLATSHVEPWVPAPAARPGPRLKIVNCGGKEIPLELGPGAVTLPELKARIKERTGIPTGSQRLYLGNSPLEEEGALAGLRDGAKLLVVQEVHGG